MSGKNPFEIFGKNFEAAKKIESEDVETGKTGAPLGFEEEKAPEAAPAGEETPAVNDPEKAAAEKETQKFLSQEELDDLLRIISEGKGEGAGEGGETSSAVNNPGEQGNQSLSGEPEEITNERIEEVLKECEDLVNLTKKGLKEEFVAEGGEQLKTLSEEFNRSIDRYNDNIRIIPGFLDKKQEIEKIFEQVFEIENNKDEKRMAEAFDLLQKANKLMDEISNENEKVLADELKRLEAAFDKVIDRWSKEIKNHNAVNREKRGEFEELAGKAELILKNARNKTKSLDKARSEMVDILTRMNSLIDEIVNEEAEKEIHEEAEKLPEKERRDFLRKIANAGWFLKEQKAKAMKWVLNEVAENFRGKLATKIKKNTEEHTKYLSNLVKDLKKQGKTEQEIDEILKEDFKEREEERYKKYISELKQKEAGKIYRFLNAYSKKVYEKEEKLAHKKRKQAKMGGLQKVSGMGQLFGNLARTGRIFYDFGHSLNPFKSITATSLFLGRFAEASKEARLMNTEVKSRTRIGGEEAIKNKDASGQPIDEEYLKAYEEALMIQEEAKKTGKMDANGNLKLSEEMYENAYKKFSNLDVLKRVGAYDEIVKEFVRETKAEFETEENPSKKINLQERIKFLNKIKSSKIANKEQLDNILLSKGFFEGIITEKEKAFLLQAFISYEYSVLNTKGFAQRAAVWSIKKQSLALHKRIVNIELDKKLTPEEKKLKQEFYFQMFESYLKDADRMVDQAGMVDLLSYTARLTEKTAKAISIGMIVDTVWKLSGKALDITYGGAEVSMPSVSGEAPVKVPEEKENGGFIEGLKNRFLGGKETKLEEETPQEGMHKEKPSHGTEVPSATEELDKEILKDLDDEILGSGKEEKHSSRFLEMISLASAYGAEPFKTFKDAFDGLKGEERKIFEEIYLNLKKYTIVVDKNGKEISAVEKIYADNGGGEKGKEAVRAKIFEIMKERNQLSKETLDVLPSKASGVIELPLPPKSKITGEKWTAEKANSHMDEWMKEWKDKGKTSEYYARVYTMFNVPYNREFALGFLQGKYKHNGQTGKIGLEEWIRDKNGGFKPSIYESKPETAPVPKAIPPPQGTEGPAAPPVSESSPIAEGAKAASSKPESLPAPVAPPASTPIPTPSAPPSDGALPQGAPTITPDQYAEKFSAEHNLIKETGADIKADSAGKIDVVYEIGKGKDFSALDKSLRRVVVDNFDVKNIQGGEITALDAAKMENVLANLREILQGKTVLGIKPEDLNGIANFNKQTGVFEISDYTALQGKLKTLFEHSDKIINEKSGALAYADNTSQSKWQEMFDKKMGAGKVQVRDFSKSSLVKEIEKELAAGKTANKAHAPFSGESGQETGAKHGVVGLTEAEKRFGADKTAKIIEESAPVVKTEPFTPPYQPKPTPQFDAYERIIKSAGGFEGRFTARDAQEIASVLGYNEVSGQGETQSLSPEFIGKVAELTEKNPDLFRELDSEGKSVWSENRLEFLNKNINLSMAKVENIFSVQDTVNQNLGREFEAETIYRNFFSDDVKISELEGGGIKILKDGEEFHIFPSGEIRLGVGGNEVLKSALVPGSAISDNVDLNEFIISSLDKSLKDMLVQNRREEALFNGLIKSKHVLIGRDLPDSEIKKILGSEKISDILDKKWPDKFSQGRSAENVREFFEDRINSLQEKMPVGDFKTDLETMNSGAFLSKYAGKLTEEKITAE